MAEALEAVRFVHFATAIAVFGIGAFRLYAFAGAAAPAGAAARAALDAAQARAMLAGALLALVSALAMIPFVAAEMAASAAAAIDPATWHAVLVDTRFGRVWCWHLGFAVALLALCAYAARALAGQALRRSRRCCCWRASVGSDMPRWIWAAARRTRSTRCST